LLQTLLASPINARRDEWFEDIATELHDLIAKVEGLSMEKLCEDPSFITTILAASRIAIGTHQKEKREALRNAVLNAALGHEPDEDFRVIFLSWVERFTPWHLKLLKLFANPTSLAKQTGFAPSGSLGSMEQLIEGVYADLRGQKDFYYLLCKDLESVGLMQGGLGVTMTSSGMFQRRITPIGDRFLEFIIEPSQ
jgi:hypothetical protein